MRIASIVFVATLLAAGCATEDPNPGAARSSSALTQSAESVEVETDRLVELTGTIDPTPEQRSAAAAALARAQAELDALAGSWSSMSPEERERALQDVRCRHTGCPVGTPAGGAR